MGQEARCTVTTGGRTVEGKALLEAEALVFRGEVRLDIPFASMTRCEAKHGDLAVAFPGGKAVFALGALAGKWAHKSRRADLDRLPKLKGALKKDGALWVIRPKGVKEITEADVMAAGKAAGLVDVKVAAFSKTHTAEKFVIPVAKR